MHVQIEESWRLRLQEEFDKPYFERLVRFVKEKYNTCPFEKVKVVILGKIFTRSLDSIMGCIFPVMDEVPFLSSLVNIFR